MHGSDHGHGGDHSYGHGAGGNYHYNQAAGHGPGHNNHFAGGGDHGGGAGMSSHGLSIAHAGDFFGHSGSIAVEGMVFMAFLDWAGGHPGGGFHYSFNQDSVHVGYDHANHIDGTGIGGYGVRRGGANRLRSVPVSEVKAKPDSRIFIVHAHNIGDPDLPLLLKIWPEKFGLVNITDYPNMGGVKDHKKGQCLSWDWAHPNDGPLPPGALPGVKVDTERFKEIFQLGKVNPNLPLWRKVQIWLGLGAPPHRGELVPDIHSNVTIEVYGLQWVYDQTGTAEVKLEIRVKPNLRYYPGSPARTNHYCVAPLFTSYRTAGTPGRWAIVEQPFEANRAAAFALAKCLHQELSQFKRVPGKLEAYLDKLSKLPGGYRPPTDIPDGVAPGTVEDERELEGIELENARNQDRGSEAQLPTTTVPTTPTTPVEPAPNVDGLPPTPDQDTGSAVDGLPGYTQYAAAAAVPLPSAPGTVTAALGLPAAAPMPETQMGNLLEGKPIKTVDGDGTVEVHVPLGDFPDYHGHHI
jgi:hypothetical protein